jgi:hypothetical protein
LSVDAGFPKPGPEQRGDLTRRAAAPESRIVVANELLETLRQVLSDFREMPTWPIAG